MNPFASPAQPVWGEPLAPHAYPFPTSDLSADVVIIGAGFSGLWTALHLAQCDPALDVVIVDAASPGYGASGRNGGWCSALMPMSLQSIAQQSSVDDARRMQRAMNETVDEIGNFIDKSPIDCGWTKGGTLHSATSPAHLQRLRDEVEAYRMFGFGDEQIRFLTASEAQSRIDARGTCGATFSPHCAAVNPRSLVSAIVDELSRTRVRIYARSRATSISPHAVTLSTPTGTVQATGDWIVRATEGFTRTITQFKRDIAPIYSFMIATEPLAESVWADIGWESRETFADARHMIIYAQRTSDNRIAFGGRGAPYKWASGVDPKFDTNERVHAKLEHTMHELFPATQNARITHRWGGPLGVPRDWFSSVNADTKNQILSVGGYVGDGVALAHLAGKTAAHLITSTASDFVTLPWVGHQSPRWEPEPLRWMGINSLLRVPAFADARERRTGRPSTALTQILEKFVK